MTLGSWVGCDVALCAKCLEDHRGEHRLVINNGQVKCDRCGYFMTSARPVVEGQELNPSDVGRRVFTGDTCGTLSSWNHVNVFICEDGETNRWKTACVAAADVSFSPFGQMDLFG